MIRKLFAEYLGTALLVTAVVGSGIMASRLSPNDIGIQLLENSIATMLALAVLILVLGPVSGAHFNPVVTLADWWLHRRLSTMDIVGYVAAQVFGAISGSILANAMFGLRTVQIAHTTRDTPHLWIGEIVATAGLVLVIFALVRSHRVAAIPAAVGAYIGAAYWFTSSTSFANPAVTIGRAFTDTFAGIAPTSVPGFVAAQLIGAPAGILAFTLMYPGEAVTGTQKPSVLFVCVHNAGRSQMAAGFLRRLAGDAVEVRSAGSAPADHINPVAVQAMQEVGIDITDQKPRILTIEDSEASSVVITMGCGDVCPYFPGQRHEDWQLDDPAGQGIDAVRLIRDDIRKRVETLVAELLPQP